MQLAECRGDVAVICSALGNNFDETECPLGCDVAANGCKQCTTNAQCEASSPVCDVATSSCHPCRVDDECDSRVCDLGTGACVDEATIVYASPSGTGSCSLSQPCSLSSAVTLAKNATGTPLVRMLPGTYTSPLDVRSPTAKPLEVVATQASIVGNITAIVVRDGASVSIRGLATASDSDIQCGNANAALSSLSIDGASLVSFGSGTAVNITRCNLKITASDFSFGSNTGTFGLSDDSLLDGDRLHLHSEPTRSNNITAGGVRATVRLTNSLLENTFLSAFTSDTVDPGSSMVFAYDTFVFFTEPLDTGGIGAPCSGATVAHRSIKFENSILASEGAFDAVGGLNPMNCVFVNSILSRQAAPPSGAIITDPQFVDIVSRDFHLKPSSPAINIAVPASIAPGADLDGNARPQGAQPDLGAYEHP
jgi:hypothetical protein